MLLAAQLATGLVALIHFYIVVLEMVLWEKPAGRRAFGTTAQDAKTMRVMAANQGLYNGFLVAGLVWGLSMGREGTAVTVFFLSCVLVAGLYGGATVSRTILMVQALPAAVALALTLLAQ